MMNSSEISHFKHQTLTKEDLRRVNLRYMFGGQLGWNYERMMNVAYVHAILPAMIKMYGDDSDVLRDMLQMEMQFYNTSPFLSAIITGMDLSLQNESGTKSKEAVAAIKTGLMGPFAAVGDSLFGAVIPTILGSLAAYMGMKGNPIGVIIWLLCAIVILGLRYFELPIAYREGKKLVSNVGNLLNNLTDAATLLGVFVIGGLIPTVVNVIVPFKLTIGKKSLAIQADMLDQILPALVPIALVTLAYWLLGRKKMNSTRVIWVFLIGSIVLYSLKLLAVG
ncbi:PTS system mannose/fructose/sorbose family transporter subunit IID [Lacticaseibacillus paracasei]|uniref:PTS system, IID component n=1 Tax=Lacticaseibacillus paracasei subsp. paracasei Lpp49 TaxID=1256213 RepID=A0ABC9TD71_LACPA|nr:PTS system mannose/fructose/sorbose family transporter subunit IID [Lacticaseibacillus paracasei]EPC91502.1 PTS system, IID component [Lacticaseibacillus paracasei subsp. paracasei Lpp49]RND41191.1 PTS system mannose-specific EIID component [Lacticaseibacillus paracasei]